MLLPGSRDDFGMCEFAKHTSFSSASEIKNAQ